jgi:hypothetical protein
VNIDLGCIDRSTLESCIVHYLVLLKHSSSVTLWLCGQSEVGVKDIVNTCVGANEPMTAEGTAIPRDSGTTVRPPPLL